MSKRNKQRYDLPMNPAPQTRPVLDDISQGFTSIVQIAKDVLINPDIAYRTDRRLSDQMIRDPMVAGPLEKRMLATAQLDWQILPENETDSMQLEVAKRIDNIFRKTPRRVDLFKSLLWGTFRGTGCAEMYWDQDELTNEWYIKHHRPHHGDKITYDIHGQPRILTRFHQVGGREISDEERDRLIIYTYNPEDGSFYEPAEAAYVYKGRGLRDSIWQYWWLKHNALKFWLTFLERFGGGFLIGKYPMGNDVAKKAIESVLRNLVSDSKVSVPVPPSTSTTDQAGTYGIEPILVPGTGEHAQMFQNFVDGWAGKHIRILIEGQEQAQQESGDGLGSGRADALQDMFRMYRDFDAHALEESISNQCVQKLQRFNFGELPFKCRFEFIIEKDTYAEAEARVNAARENRLVVAKTWVYDSLGIPVPKDDEEVMDYGMMAQQDMVMQAQLEAEANGNEQGGDDEEYQDRAVRRRYGSEIVGDSWPQHSEMILHARNLQRLRKRLLADSSGSGSGRIILGSKATQSLGVAAIHLHHRRFEEARGAFAGIGKETRSLLPKVTQDFITKHEYRDRQGRRRYRRPSYFDIGHDPGSSPTSHLWAFHKGKLITTKAAVDLGEDDNGDDVMADKDHGEWLMMHNGVSHYGRIDHAKKAISFEAHPDTKVGGDFVKKHLQSRYPDYKIHDFSNVFSDHRERRRYARPDALAWLHDTGAHVSERPRSSEESYLDVGHYGEAAFEELEKKPHLWAYNHKAKKIISRPMDVWDDTHERFFPGMPKESTPYGRIDHTTKKISFLGPHSGYVGADQKNDAAHRALGKMHPDYGIEEYADDQERERYAADGSISLWAHHNGRIHVRPVNDKYPSASHTVWARDAGIPELETAEHRGYVQHDTKEIFSTGYNDLNTRVADHVEKALNKRFPGYRIKEYGANRGAPEEEEEYGYQDDVVGQLFRNAVMSDVVRTTQRDKKRELWYASISKILGHYHDKEKAKNVELWWHSGGEIKKHPAWSDTPIRSARNGEMIEGHIGHKHVLTPHESYSLTMTHGRIDHNSKQIGAYRMDGKRPSQSVLKKLTSTLPGYEVKEYTERQ